jgi:hypothetical protein
MADAVGGGEDVGEHGGGHVTVLTTAVEKADKIRAQFFRYAYLDQEIARIGGAPQLVTTEREEGAGGTGGGVEGGLQVSDMVGYGAVRIEGGTRRLLSAPGDPHPHLGPVVGDILD